jgi:hypothetical protein
VICQDCRDRLSRTNTWLRCVRRRRNSEMAESANSDHVAFAGVPSNRAGGFQQQFSSRRRFCILSRHTLNSFSSSSIKIVFAIPHAGREKPFRAALHECGAGHPFPQFTMKPFRDESLRCGSIIFGELTICPNREHHVFGHNRLRYRNSPTRRRNEAAQIKNVVHQTAVITIHEVASFCKSPSSRMGY